MQRITPQDLKALLLGEGEIALLDVRERNPFSKEQLLLSCCVPLGRIETTIGDLVPRRSARIVLMSDGPSDIYRLDVKAAEKLKNLGYTDVAILDGGIRAWREAGFEVYSGVNVLSKAFGEIVCETYKTPFLKPEDEQQKIAGRERQVILDSRPKNEYHRMTIPGSINAPGAELVYRVHDAVPDPCIPVVVHCAGRTRSIIGTQSLVNAGIPNPVAALENGTMGWQLAGFDLEYGQTRFAAPPSPEGLARARECAARVGGRFGVRKITHDTLKEWRGEAGKRTLYLIDVRLPEEYEAGHMEGSSNVQGGQLIQATDLYIAVYNSRIVLVDDTEVRAVMTASWLIQMGWQDVFVLEGGLGNHPLVSGPYIAPVLGFEKADTLNCEELREMLRKDAGGLVVLDVAASGYYAARHIPGAWWGIRSRLEADLEHLPEGRTLVLTSEDGIMAHLTAGDLKRSGFKTRVAVLEGGTEAWCRAGLETSAGMDHAISERDDDWYMPYMFPDAPEEAKRGYLEWEIALVQQVERDGTARFKIFPEHKE